MHIFAVTYTYNDTALVNDLLDEISRWPIRPRTILVVDDGSDPSYAPDPAAHVAASDIALKSLRLAPNQGPARAKRAGLQAAAASGAEVILSLDADIRPHPAWLSAALPFLADPGIGLVGASFAPGPGNDSLSRYLRAFFTPAPIDQAVPFLGAGLWLLRRDVWLGLDGFADFAQPTHEDLYFCRKLAAAGLRMQAVNSKPVLQIRRLQRHAYVRREIAYIGQGARSAAHRQGLEKALLLPLVQQSLPRLQHILEQEDAEFLYLEIFKYAALLAWLRDNSANSPDQAGKAANLLAGCLEGLAAYPNTLALLREDLAAIGLAQGPSRAGLMPLESALVFGVEQLRPLFLKLEMHGVNALNQEQQAMPFDAHYLTPHHLSSGHI